MLFYLCIWLIRISIDAKMLACEQTFKVLPVFPLETIFLFFQKPKNNIEN